MLISKRRFRLFNELRKCGSVVYRKVCQNFSVERDPRAIQTAHKFAVGKTVDSCRRVDSCDPKTTEISLSSSSADERVVQRLHNRFASDSVRLTLVAEIALGELKNLSTLLNSVYTSFNTHNYLSPFLLILVRHHVLHGAFLRRRNKSALSQMSSSFAGLGFRFVVFTAVRSVHFARAGKPKTLFRTAVSFLFRHIFVLRNFFLIFFFISCACPRLETLSLSDRSRKLILRAKGSLKYFYLP